MSIYLKSELIFELAKGVRSSKGFKKETKKHKHGIEESFYKILSDSVAEKIGRDIGSYFCLNFDDFAFYDLQAKDLLSKKLQSQIEKLLKTNKVNAKKILVVGLGNEKYACDSLGAKVCSKLLITKPYLDKKLFDENQLCEIYGITMGVYGTTGLDSSEVIKAVCNYLSPDLVIAIDSMITEDKNRLAKSIQLSDTKLIPGGGVGNARREISYDSIGIPVFAIGVPLVVNTNIFGSENDNLIVTPKDVETKVRYLSTVIANGINKTFTNISDAELSQLTI